MVLDLEYSVAVEGDWSDGKLGRKCWLCTCYHTSCHIIGRSFKWTWLIFWFDILAYIDICLTFISMYMSSLKQSWCLLPLSLYSLLRNPCWTRVTNKTWRIQRSANFMAMAWFLKQGGGGIWKTYLRYICKSRHWTGLPPPPSCLIW